MNATITRAATNRPLIFSSTDDAGERSPLLSPTDARGPLPSPHWDAGLEAHGRRRLNPAHQFVRGLVPAALQPDRAAWRTSMPSYLPPFVVTEEDARRGNALVMGTQFLVGSIGVAAALDGWLAFGPTSINPRGEPNVGLALGGTAAAALGFTVLGAALGNLWYNALLTASARSWRTLQVHPKLTTRCAEGAALVSLIAVVLGAVFSWSDLIQRSQAADPEGPAPYNAVYESLLAFDLLVTGPHVVVNSNWYLGRLAGAVVARVVSPHSPAPSDAETYQSADEASDTTAASFRS